MSSADLLHQHSIKVFTPVVHITNCRVWHITISLGIEICSTNQNNPVQSIEYSYEIVFIFKRRQDERYAS